MRTPGVLADDLDDVMPRLMERVMPEPMSGCWLWTGAVNNAGYGQLNVIVNGKRTMRLAHRLTYSALVGPIGEGLALDHLCRVRGCCNPAHLEPVTGRENLLRSTLTVTRRNADKTHCLVGHPFDDRNTYWRPEGGRDCKTCARRRRLEREAVPTDAVVNGR